ncbi:putative ribonuclease h protein [Nicotiana attenuata]|uniref:Ribonuclease h protein n=1 Tax=Nicotiana attenuata TaxID=49451 RepID=A0A314KJ71_NICAT|nr:putative ribonuclease h protein [Nicotiana attenuata]
MGLWEISNLEKNDDQQWRLHSGNTSFWWDNWLGVGPLANFKQNGGRPGKVTVSNFWSEGQWDIQKLNPVAPIHMIPLILQIQIHNNHHIQDKAIWNPTSSGAFTCGSAWCAAKYGGKTSAITRTIYSITSDLLLLLRSSYSKVKWPPNWPEIYHISEQLIHYTSVQQVMWLRPTVDHVKVNTDGSALDNPGKIGAGIIIRGHEGQFIHAIASPLGIGTNNQAESEAAYIGIRWCIENGFSKIHFEADSKLLILWLTTSSEPPWSLSMLLQKIKTLCQQCESISYTHVFREANYPADSLSKLSHDLTTLTHFNNQLELPSQIRVQIILDQ